MKSISFTYVINNPSSNPPTPRKKKHNANFSPFIGNLREEFIFKQFYMDVSVWLQEEQEDRQNDGHINLWKQPCCVLD